MSCALPLIDKTHMPVLRWLLLVPSGIAGVCLGFAAALALLGIADRFCPPDLLISGMCTASWYRTAERAALCSGAAVGAIAAVALPTFVAPAHKARVAAMAFCLGAVYALWGLAAAGAYAWPALASALAAGMAALGWVLARGRMQAAPSSKQTLGDGA